MREFIALLLAILVALPAQADSPIIWFGTHSKDLTASGMAFKNGTAGTPSMSYLSAPNTGLFLDGSGNVGFAKGGNATLAVGTGLSFPATFIPVDNEGTLTQHSFQTAINPTGNVTTASSRNLIQLEENIGTDDSGFSVDSAFGLSVNLNSRNKSSWNNLKPFQINSQIGNGTDPQTGNIISMGSFSGNLQSGATVNFYDALQMSLNAVAGSVIGNYVGVHTNAQIAAATNYTGIRLGDNLGTVTNANPVDITTNVSGSLGQFQGISLNGTIASITGGYDGVHASHNLTLTGGATVFSDTTQVTAMTAASSYNSINIAPGIGTMSGTYTTLRSFPIIVTGNGVTAFEDGTLVTGSAVNYLGLNIHPSLTGMTGDVSGIIFQPNGTTATNATGLNIDMTGITAGGTKTAITTNGAPVQVNNADFSVNGGTLHINAPPQAFVNVGNPTTVHNISTSYVAPASAVVANADSIGFGPIANVTLGHDAHITSGGLGVGTASLGIISLLTLDDSSTIADVGGSFVAHVLTGGTGAGGVVGNAYGYRYVAGNGGSPSSITNVHAYLADDPLGPPAANAWGFYSRSSYENYFGKSLKIGGADTVSNASVGLEVEGKAVYPLPMTTVARDALTALKGMLINNVTTGFLERYDGAAWVAIQSALTLGNLTDSGTDGITVGFGTGAVIGAGTTLSQHVADGTHNGYLSAVDWTSFNAVSGAAVTSLTGDVTGTGPGATATTIANNAVTNVKIANGTIDLAAKVTGVLPTANGGTNSAAALANNRVMQSSGGAIVEAAAITPSRALISDANGIPTQSTVTSATLAFLDATSSVQTQLNGKQPLSTELTGLASLAANGIVARTGAGTYTPRTITAGSTKISVTNGDGVAGNPTIDVNQGNLSLASIGGQASLTTQVSGTLPVTSGGTGVTTSTGTGNTVLSASPTFTGTAVFNLLNFGESNLGKYKEANGGGNSTTWKFNGAGTVAGAASTYAYTVIGKMCTIIMSLASMNATTAAAGSTALTSQTAIPAECRPSDALQVPVPVMSAGTTLTTPGWMTVSAAGIFSIYLDATATTNWASLVNAGISQAMANQLVFTWSLQ